MQAHKLVEYSDVEHGKLLAVAAIDGCDFSEIVPNAQRYVGYGATKHGYGAACVLDLTGTQYVAEPHVVWFPWTSRKDKIVNFKWAMSMLAETREVLLNVSKENAVFFDHFARNKFLRKIGVIEVPASEEKEIHMYQVNRSKTHE